jgi:hypothetical protein
MNELSISTNNTNNNNRKFADNTGIPFYTPEEYFLKEKSVAFKLDGINPKEYINRSK